MHLLYIFELLLFGLLAASRQFFKLDMQVEDTCDSQTIMRGLWIVTGCDGCLIILLLHGKKKKQDNLKIKKIEVFYDVSSIRS